MTLSPMPLRFALLLIALSIARSASAQTLGLTPAEIQASFKPQQIVQFELNVSNDGDLPVPMRGNVTDLWFEPKTNEKTFGTPGTSPRSAANWITFVPSTFTVPPHGTGKVKVVITPPPGVAGGSYAVLFLESKPELTSDTTGGRPLYANMRLGALVLLSAEGTETFAMDVGDLTLTPPFGNRSLELAVELTNTSNTHIFPATRLTVMNAANQVVARAEGDTKRFFPGQKDSLKLTWAGSLPAGDYKALVTIAYGKDKVFTKELPLHVEAVFATAAR